MNQPSPTAIANRTAWVRWLSFMVVAALGTAIDLWTKQWVFSWRGLPGQLPPYWLIDSYVGIETAVNPGALFGLGAGWGSLFAALSVFAAAAIFLWLYKFRAIDSWWLVIALGCILGGILGNLYDRLGLWNPPPEMPIWSSGVRDWILFQYNADYVWPNFNIADSLLVCGAIMLAIHSFWITPPSSDAKASDAKASDAKASDAKASDAKASDAKASDAKASDANRSAMSETTS